MSTAKDINSLLDDMLVIRSEINRMRADLKSNETLVNNQTGEKINANKIEELANNEINEIKKELNKVTNNENEVKDIILRDECATKAIISTAAATGISSSVI